MAERENACDEEVLRGGARPEAYAEGILKICERYLESPLKSEGAVRAEVSLGAAAKGYADDGGGEAEADKSRSGGRTGCMRQSLPGPGLMLTLACKNMTMAQFAEQFRGF